jgi:glycosyltransferase involved in cell wall biosynthesis
VVSKGICARIAGEIIPCGVDLEVFSPRDRIQARMRLGLSLEDKLILFPFDPSRKLKRYDLACSVVSALGATNVHIMTVCGTPNDEMPWYYSAADAMILCSESEGSPTSVKEALACNLPIVSTDVGDVREIMGKIEGCEICDSNVPDLVRGLRRVLERPSDKRVEGFVHMARYDQSRTTAAIVGVYERAIRNRSSTRNES